MQECLQDQECVQEQAQRAHKLELSASSVSKPLDSQG